MADATQGEKDLNELNEMVSCGSTASMIFSILTAVGAGETRRSDHFMTAYVVWGLTCPGRGPGKGRALERGVAFLDKEIVEEEENYDQRRMFHALSITTSRGLGQLENSRPGPLKPRVIVTGSTPQPRSPRVECPLLR